MSRPIRLSDKIIKSIVAGIAKDLKGHKVFDDTIDISYEIPVSNKDATLIFKPAAFAKMMMLINSFDSEVAWHGTVTREDRVYVVQDIFVYPQKVSGASVNTDQEEYEKWLYGLDDEQFNDLRFQGHSHVNMGVTPSSVDLNHQERIVEQLEDDMFYIFMIWNKKMEYTVKIFDLTTNTLYEKKDVNVFIGEVPFDNADFIKDAKAMVKSASYNAYSYNKKSSKDEDLDDEDYGFYNGYRGRSFFDAYGSWNR